MNKWKRVFPLLIAVVFVFPFFTHAQAVHPDTLKICALRVQFARDNNELTTGDGQFMIDTTTTDPYAIDPAPHDKQYFQDQITAASNYFRSVSKGRLVVVGDVFPAGPKDAFTLDKPMGAYNPNTTDEEINKGISRLFVDAVKAADRSNAGIDFSKYDLVVVFHAGVGRDVNLGFDPTPQDIPSLYLSDAFFRKTLGDTFGGITVNGGHFKIHKGILLPETENQEGHAIALTGMFVSNIGSYLGLYDLFSPSTQRSGVGRFGLMDAGLLNMNGLVPAPPSAFSRTVLGWDQARIIDQPQKQIPVARLFGDNPSGVPTLYKVPINDDEYYLVECRGVPGVNIDSLFQTLYQENTPAPTYLQVLKTFFADQIEFGPSGVLTKVANYDLGLPGNGILIWHIDRRIIREKGPQNKINDDPEQRGVALVEADAAQDIGQNYSLLDAGYQTELGWFADFWFKNRPPYIKNFELYTNELSSTSHPASLSNRDHAFTHIKLYDFSSNSGPVMTFSFAREMMEKGFPQKLPATGKITAMIAGQTAKGTYLFLGDSLGNVFALTKDSLSGLPSVYLVWKDSLPVRALTLLKTAGAASFSELIVTTSHRLTLVSVFNRFGSLQPGRTLVFKAPATITAAPVSVGNKFYLACANDSLYAFAFADHKLNLLKRLPGFAGFSDLAASIDGVFPQGLTGLQGVISAGVSIGGGVGPEFILARNEAKGVQIDYISNNKTISFQPPVKAQGHFALANLTRGPEPEVVFNGQREVYATNFNGTLVEQFPLRPFLSAGDRLVGTPLVADLNADGNPEIVVETARGVLLALGLDNRLIANFPLSVGGHVSLSPILLQWDGDEQTELAAVTDSGRVYLWNVPGSKASGIVWGQADLDGTRNKLFESYYPLPPVNSASLDLLPARKVYNYPNPNQGDFTTIRYYLTIPAKVTVRIFDLSGTLITSLNGPGEGQTDNEVVWNVEHVASGVYLCQVEAKAGRRTQRRLFKIMVVH